MSPYELVHSEKAEFPAGPAVRRRRRFALPVAPNVPQRRFDPSRPDEAWVGDITYIWTNEGWAYLAVIIDLFSRRVVGWAIRKALALERPRLRCSAPSRGVGPFRDSCITPIAVASTPAEPIVDC